MKAIILTLILVNGLLGIFNAQSCLQVTDPEKISNTTTIVADKFATISNTCAPWDGPALSIQISEKERDCDDKGKSDLMISIWQSGTEVSGKTINLPDKKLGTISRVGADGKHEFATKGTVIFGKVEDESDVTFAVEIEFDDGDKMRGKFRAKRCKNDYICG